MYREAKSCFSESSDDGMEEYIVRSFYHIVEDDMTRRVEDTKDIWPEDIIIELLWNLVIDKEVDNNESVLLRGFLNEIISILTDNLSIRVRIEGKFLSRNLDDNRIDINSPNSIRYMKLVPEERHNRTSPESEEEYILWGRKCYLTDSKSHNPMKRAIRVVCITSIENLFPVYEHNLQISTILRNPVGYKGRYIAYEILKHDAID